MSPRRYIQLTAAEPGVLASAPKRVVLEVTPAKIASWDHRKLGGRLLTRAS